MEAVRVKKPKPKPRTVDREREATPVREAPPIPLRQPVAVVGGHVLPDVPMSSPGVSSAQSRSIRSRSASPEPEEIEIGSPLEPSVSTRSDPSNEVIHVPSPTVVEAPPLPPRNLIFPRSTTAGNDVREAPPLSEKSDIKESEPAPVVSQQSFYPSIPSLAPVPSYTQSQAMNSNRVTTTDKPKEVRARVAERVVDAPPMYPSISHLVYEKNKQGLLSEQHLLSFYHNALYDGAEEFEDRFVTEEELPSGPLFPLLGRLKLVSEQLILCEVAEKENAESLRNCQKECWTVQEKTITYQGRCGDDRDGVGTGRYQTTIVNGEKLDEMRRLFNTNRNILLNERLSQEVEFRSLGLQIQWKVISINQQFMGENNLTQQSHPTLLLSTVNNSAREIMKKALSDIFYHLRFPSLSKKYVEALTSWATELTCVLQMWCRSEDSQFLLCHLLRLPSPICEWAAPMVQTFASSASPSKLKVDHCVAMISYLMTPIKNREEFLRQIGQSEKEEATWAILSDDDEDDSEFSFVTINETDLVALLEQLSISEFYSLAFNHFSQEATEKSAQFVSLIAFQLLLMKILSDGLSTYDSPNYKMFCKQIGMCLRQSVRELCSHWRVTRNVVTSSECDQLQKEVDRIVLLAVQYIIQHQNLGLWQFSVDLPYDCVSEECRVRAEFLLRSSVEYSVRELYDIPIQEVAAKCSNTNLSERIEQTGAVDAVFLVNALSAITSHSIADPTKFVKEIIELCFCDDSTRGSLYKVGGEAIAQVLLRKPNLLDPILGIIDRKIDAMGNYSIDTLSSSLLSDCRIGEAVLGSIVGKWIINRGPEHPANRLGRRILSSLHWGFDESGHLWMDESVHQMCADTVVKAHMAHCGKSNGLIAKSIQKVAKLASKIPDYEQHFNQFVWDILVKLKLPVTLSTVVPKTDLAAFFVHLVQHSMASVDQFLDKGVGYLNELITSGCSTACVVVLGRLMNTHYKEISAITGNKSFLEVFDRIIHVDQCSYAVQLLTGPSSTPTPMVRLIVSTIASSCKSVDRVDEYLRAWVELLCGKRLMLWNSDQVSLQILGTIARLAFLKDNLNFLGLRSQLHSLYMQMVSQWRESSKGFLSMFSSDSPPIPLILNTYYGVAPWATYLLLLVEETAFPQYYQFFFDSVGKKEKNTVEQAAKKAATKSSIALTPDRIHCYRWAEFIGYCKNSEILPLAVQQLAVCLFSKRMSNGKKMVFSKKLVSAPYCSNIISDCKKELEGLVHDKGYYKAVAGWIFSDQDVSSSGFNFGRFDLDYLLQLILADDKNLWLDFVDLVAINMSIGEEENLLPLVCHCDRRVPTRVQWDGPTQREKTSRALPFPSLPIHPGLPPMPKMEVSIMLSQQLLMDTFAPFIKNINKQSEQFANACDALTEYDQKYCDLLTRLYTPVVQNVPISIRCSRCTQPGAASAQVTTNEFSQSTDAEMSQNRERRGTQLTGLQASILDSVAMQTASLEFIAGMASLFASTAPSHHRSNIQMTGRGIFYLLTSSITSEGILFPAATSSFEHSLRTLGQEFVRYRPEEQQIVMKLVLDGFVLSDPLVEVFTPECLSSSHLCDVYARLSEAVKNPERSPRALKLLARLAIDHAAASLPPQQFSALMPLAFNNVASQPDPSSPLHQLCLSHLITFVFHKFPLNFVTGLDLALEGCTTGVTPSSLFSSFVDKLGAEQWENPRGDYRLNGVTSLQCCVVTTRRLSEARTQLGANMYTVWAKYLDHVSLLSQCFIHTSVRETFTGEMPESVARKVLVESFGRLSSLYSPLISPPSPSVPPFSPSHDEIAGLVVGRMVQNIIALPYNTSMSPGQQNVNSLVWQFFCEKLSRLTHGTTHYFSVLEPHLIRIHWASFWPSLVALSAMDDVIFSRSADSIPLVAQIFVRIPWQQVLDKSLPDDIRPAYLSALFSTLTRLVAKQHNYMKVRASLLELIRQFTQRDDWKCVPPESCEKIGLSISESFPHDTLHNPNDVIALHQSLWRVFCVFSPSLSSSSSSILLKQRSFVISQLRLLIRSSHSHSLPQYNAIIADCNAIAKTHANPRPFCVVARELTACWTTIGDVKLGEIIVSGWSNYLRANPESPLVVCCLHTLIDSLNNDQLTTALKVMDRTIITYFNRSSSSWSKLLEWCSFPSKQMTPILQYLTTVPTSDNKVTPLFLTLRVLLDHGVHSDEVFLKSIEYITNIKPKYVDCEASYLLLLHRLIRWMCEKYTKDNNTNSDILFQFLRWLPRIHSEEKGGFLSGIMGGKKNQHSHKLRTLLHIFSLYLTQQSPPSPDRLPRLNGNDPVHNTRLTALKELSAQKSNLPLSSLFNLSTVYFVSVDDHFLQSAPSLLAKLAKEAYKEKYVQF